MKTEFAFNRLIDMDFDYFGSDDIRLPSNGTCWVQPHFGCE